MIEAIALIITLIVLSAIIIYYGDTLSQALFIPKSTTYTQRITIPRKSIEEAHKTIILWLIDNRCSITKQDPPTSIEALYRANPSKILMGAGDNHPKTINIQLIQGRNVSIEFLYSQVFDSVGNSGYVFWAFKLGELYEELGVDVTEAVWSELIPEGSEDYYKKRVILIVLLLVAAILLSIRLYLGKSSDFLVTFYLLYIVPFGVLTFFELKKYRKIMGHLKH